MKGLLSAGIALIVACAVFFILAALYHSTYKQLYDGAAETYRRLRRNAARCFASGFVLAAAGMACITIYALL